MRVEEIAVRQEVRQMLNEAGINRNALKEMVKEVLQEEVSKACRQTISERCFKREIDDNIENSMKNMVWIEVQKQLRGIFNRIEVSIDITDKDGQSVVAK